MSVTVRPKQLKEILRFAIRHRESVMVVGAPGVGKTDIMQGVTKEEDCDLILSHPVVSDPTDFKGLPWPSADKKSAVFLPFGDFEQALCSTKRTVWFLDDFGQAPPAVQAAAMQLILARRINGYKLPRDVLFMVATNRRTDRAGVQGILEPVKSRFGTIVELSPTVDDWIEWALSQSKFSPEVIAFIRFKPDLLHNFTPTADMVNSPSPRTWAAVSRHLVNRIPKDVEFQVITGCVGQGATSEFSAFLDMYRNLPDVDDILDNPAKAPIPEEVSILYALISALAYRCTRQTLGATFKYAARLAENGKAEFCTLLVKDIVVRNSEFANTKEWVELIHKSKLGKILGVA